MGGKFASGSVVIGTGRVVRSIAAVAMHAAQLLGLLLFFVAPAHPAQAQERTLDLSGPVAEERVAAHIDYLLDESHALGISDVLGPRAGDFRPIVTKSADFGYTDAMIWLRLRVANTTAETRDWRIYFHENFKQVFHVYIVDSDGNVDHAVAQEIDSPFTTRAIAFPELVSPLRVAPGGTATVFVRFWTEGSTNLPLSIETVESFTAISARKSAKNFVFYGMMLVLIVAAFLSMLVLRHPIFPAYIAYAGATLLYIMHSDGVAFQYLWPHFPLFNSIASVVAGGSYAVFGALYARIFLNTPKYHPLIDKLLLAVMAVVVVMVASIVVVEPRVIKKTLILVVLFAVMLFTVAGLVAARRRFKQVRFYVIAWLGAMISATLMTVRHWFGVEISQEFQYDSMRVVMIFDAAMMGMAIVDRYSQLRAERQAAMQSSLDHARRNLDMTKRLRDLEEGYEMAVQTSALRDQQLENTVHDLRQPLHALRLVVHGAINGNQAQQFNYADIDDSFRYLETLVTDHLDRAVARENAEAKSAVADGGEVPLDDILRKAHDMFLADAREKGLEFVYVPTSAVAQVEPLAMMRIVINLVANAIKYTDAGKVLLGVRRRHGDVRIEVHDTGPGLDGNAFAEACERSVRLASAQHASDGHGFGLAIVTELAERHGYRIGVVENRRTGTGIAIDIPAAPESAYSAG
jgi:signal transduction histidine kinase